MCLVLIQKIDEVDAEMATTILNVFEKLNFDSLSSTYLKHMFSILTNILELGGTDEFNSRVTSDLRIITSVLERSMIPGQRLNWIKKSKYSSSNIG